MAKVLICGGRDFNDVTLFNKTLEPFLLVSLLSPLHTLEIISGMARGADTLAVEYARKAKLVLHEFPADWKTYGNKAGPIRNQQMIDEGKPDLVIAFPGGNGTADMVRRAKKHNIEVIEVERN